ncbi:hypothetical protein SDC9_171358 [bioreactor metagenome]|uniref:Uncharacterized protein n=1 Tax=bioreactor metagenome TaxID=1076179 RepID=A0A645GBE8_9ZZZZ
MPGADGGNRKGPQRAGKPEGAARGGELRRVRRVFRHHRQQAGGHPDGRAGSPGRDGEHDRGAGNVRRGAPFDEPGR